MKLRWHGCGGLFTIPLPAEVPSLDTRCGNIEEKTASPRNERAKFIDCSCYGSLLSGLLNDGCALVDEWYVSPSDAAFSDICILSAAQDNDGGPWKPKLNVPLPSTLLIHQSTPNGQDMNELKPDWKQYPLITFLDTSCDASRNTTEGSIPIYPGYGKFANTCPSEGLIDLKPDDNQIHLPHSFNGFYGQPPIDMFWFEFLDGTSTSFWPSKEEMLFLSHSNFFSPPFSQCTCNECPSETPSSIPTVKPTTAMTEELSREFAPGCPVALYEDCFEFASTRCLLSDNGDICRYSFAAADGSQARKLSLLEDVVANINNRKYEQSQRLLSEVFNHAELSYEWINSQMEQHLHQIHLLNK